MASMTLSSARLDRRDRRLSRGGMPRWNAHSREQARRSRQQLSIEVTMQSTVRLLSKLALIALISIIFLYCASAILATTVMLPIKVIALAAWSCGFVPVSHYLWNS